MGLAAVLFLGGWNGPLPIATWLGLTPEHGAVAAWIGNLLGLCNFIAKAVIGVTCMIWARWTLPRLRIDQVMTTCLKYCVPLASAMMAGAMLWTYFFPDGAIAKFWRPAAAAERVEPLTKPLTQKCKLQNEKCKMKNDPSSPGDKVSSDHPLLSFCILQFAFCNLHSGGFPRVTDLHHNQERREWT
jgi:hypothetical protein